MDTKKLVQTAMFTALVLLATMVFKIQTPVLGYIHLGDAFVLLSAVILGPLSGGAAAGLGSALADLLGGYAVWCPGTLVIKFLTAFTAAHIYQGIDRFYSKEKYHPSRMILASVSGEIVMVIGYFIFNILIVIFSGGEISETAFSNAVTVSVAEVPFNIIQAVSGIIIASLLCPVFEGIMNKIKN